MEMTLSGSDIARRYPLVVFDLDDTLYAEQDYLFAGYRAIGKYLADRGYGDAELYSDFLIEEFRRNGRKQLFDAFLARFALPVKMSALLGILHTVPAPIRLSEQAQELLDMLRDSGNRLYILTNGNLTQQQNKVDLLGLQERYPGIGLVYASAIEPKPSPKALLLILEKEGIRAEDALLVGDSESDALTARSANVDYINIQNIQP